MGSVVFIVCAIKSQFNVKFIAQNFKRPLIASTILIGQAEANIVKLLWPNAHLCTVVMLANVRLGEKVGVN
jgi:hypothetical protein